MKLSDNLDGKIVIETSRLLIYPLTDPDNKASQRVLAKAGFIANGVMGLEGPRFVLNR